MSKAVSAAAKVDFASLSTKLRPETVVSLNAFRRKHSELVKELSDLKEASVSIDFKAYSGLSNQKVVSEAQKALSSFKPAKLDLNKNLSIIKTQEAAAVFTFFRIQSNLYYIDCSSKSYSSSS